MPYGSATSLLTSRRSGSLGLLNQVNAHPTFENSQWQIEADLVATTAERQDILNELWPNSIISRVECELESAGLVIVPSQFVASDLQSRGLASTQLVIAPYGVEFPINLDRRWSDRPDMLKVLYVGHVGYRKGLRYLAEAVRAMGSRIQLTIAGPRVNRSHILERIPGSFRYVGTVDRSSLTELYKSADVFVLPSLAEGMARVVLEAMSYGLPVVVTPNAGCNEVVRNGTDGYIVAPRNVPDIIQTFESFLTQVGLLERMGRSARERSRDFPWSAFASAVFDAIAARTPFFGST